MALPVYCDGYCQHQQNLVISHIEDPNPELAHIDETLTHVGAHIQQLLKLQASLLRHHNHYHSLTYTLPPEVLSEIFLLTCTPKWTSWEEFGEPTSQVIILSSVSSYWRWVALQSPKLWSRVTLVAEERTSQTKAALLQHFFQLGIKLDVSVALQPRRWPCDTPLRVRQRLPDTADAPHQSIANILFDPENAPKITTLRLISPPAEWSVKISQLPHIHTLVLKDLRDGYNSPVVLNLLSQPLRRICLSGSPRSSCKLSLNLPLSVQELLVEGIGRDIMLESLYQCPGLIKVYGLDSSFFSVPFDCITTPLTLSQLETLTWPAGQFLDSVAVQNLSLPALKHLHLIHHEYDDPPLLPIITLCHQLSKTLKSLEFMGWWDQDLGSFFRHDSMPHLEVLKLMGWEIDELMMAVQALTPSKREFRCHEVKSLPHLQTLTLEADYRGESTEPEEGAGSGAVRTAVKMAELCLKMLKRRRAGEFDPFYLDLPVLRFAWKDRKYVWSTELQDRFRQVVRGRKLEVRQYSDVLKWL